MNFEEILYLIFRSASRCDNEWTVNICILFIRSEGSNLLIVYVEEIVWRHLTLNNIEHVVRAKSRSLNFRLVVFHTILVIIKFIGTDIWCDVWFLSVHQILTFVDVWRSNLGYIAQKVVPHKWCILWSKFVWNIFSKWCLNFHFILWHSTLCDCGIL